MSEFIEKEKLIEALDRIENKESELLAWGDIEIYSSKAEIEASLKESGVSDLYVGEYFKALKNRCYIFDVGAEQYRSRMAETVRLQLLSRQWFSKKNVEDAKPLISDFRFLKRARQYPKRDQHAQSLISKWKQNKLLKSNDEKLILSNLLRNGVDWFQLSGFQVRSTERILEKFDKHKSNKNKDSSATIVCAGTGSGKTLSFYLPAMTKLASELLQDQGKRVRILAIYPRKELLKDQFSETYKEARKLDAFLAENGKRKITIGTFYGDTLYESYTDDGKVFEPMLCPQQGCGGALRYNKQSKQAVCESESCKSVLPKDEVLVTRESVKNTPPDILFTTTEMLNQRISDGSYNHLFGVGNNSKAIPLVLLDEVHTYEAVRVLRLPIC